MASVIRRSVAAIATALFLVALVAGCSLLPSPSSSAKPKDPTVTMNVEDARTAMIAAVESTQSLLGGTDWRDLATPSFPDGCSNDSQGNTTGASFELARTRTDTSVDPKSSNDKVLAAWKTAHYTIDTENHFSPTQYAIFATTPDGIGVHFENDTGVLKVDGTTNCVPVDDFQALQEKYLAMPH